MAVHIGGRHDAGVIIAELFNSISRGGLLGDLERGSWG
jgi:hypothetical protein